MAENTGHGHVYPRPDGVKARCGGPALCSTCAADAARKAVWDRANEQRAAKCLRDIGFNMQCQEPEGHVVGPCRWHRPTAFG